MTIPTDEEIRIAVATLVSNYLRAEDYAYPHERERQEMTARFTKVYRAALKQLQPLLSLVEQVREARKTLDLFRKVWQETDGYSDIELARMRLDTLRDQLELGE